MVRREIGVAPSSTDFVSMMTLTLESPLRSLRAACAFYQIGQSGGKRKCFSRLVAHQGAMELIMAKDVAARGNAMNQRIPMEQTFAKAPTEEEKRAHELTRVPFAPWCSALYQAHRPEKTSHRTSAR